MACDIHIKGISSKWHHEKHVNMFVCFVALRPIQQLLSWRDSQFTLPRFFLGKLEQAANQYFVHILLIVTDNNPS